MLSNDFCEVVKRTGDFGDFDSPRAGTRHPHPASLLLGLKGACLLKGVMRVVGTAQARKDSMLIMTLEKQNEEPLTRSGL
jgi:hypothetical protein